MVVGDGIADERLVAVIGVDARGAVPLIAVLDHFGRLRCCCWSCRSGPST